MTNLPVEPYKGTRDWYPADMRVRQYVFNVWQRVARRYGYEAYDAPLLEPVDVYAAKSGQELVSEQTYQLVDRGDRHMAIRPEMTPSVSRMIAAKQQEIALPARWYSVAQFMRYERPQRGRDREFWQLNCDLFGQNGPYADAEIIGLGAALMAELGASHDMFTIKVNNRRIVDVMMTSYLELDTVQSQLMIRLFDRKNKIAPEAFRDEAIEIFGDDMAPQGLQRLSQLLSAKSMADLPEIIRDSDATREVQELFVQLEQAGVKNVIFDITLMRGLDYYTGTVFEFYDTDGKNTRSLFGGGRYDGLVGLFGGTLVSAVGMAMGYSMTELFLQTHDLLPKLYSSTDVYAIVIGDVLQPAQSLVRRLRNEGVNIELDTTKRKMDKQLKTAVKKSVPYILFIGEDEVANEVYSLKDTVSGNEEKLSFERIVTTVSDRRKHYSADLDDDLYFD